MRSRRRLNAALVILVLLTGLLGTWALVGVVQERERTYAAAAMDQRVEVVENAVAAEVRRYVEISTDLATAIGAQSDLSAADFTALSSNLTQLRLPGVSGVSLAVPATAEEIPGVQRTWRARGSTDLTLAAAGSPAEHLFVVLNQPLDGTPASPGRDLSQAPEPTQAMTTARSTGEVTASPTYVLLRDRELPVAEQQQSFVLASPIVSAAGTPREGDFLGWLMTGMRGQDFIDQTLRQASQDTVAVTLSESATSSATSVPVARTGEASAAGASDLSRQVTIPMAGRTWQLQVEPTTRFFSGLGPSLSASAGVAGVLVTVLLALVVGILSTSRNRALAQVESATSALRADIERRELVEAALREREDELHLMALTDPLTGLANRRAFMDELDQSHARALRHDRVLHVLFCDVDDFKQINDTYGHAAGDAVLCEVAARLLRHFRAEDTVGRLGGDEFAVICEDGATMTEDLVGRLQDVLAAPYPVGGRLVAATVSVGTASPREGESSQQLLERADSTMYLVKAARSL